jgi:hypothetical protein
VKGHVSVRPTRFYTFIHKEKVKASFTKCRALWGLKVLSKTTRENSSDEANWKWVFFFFFWNIWVWRDTEHYDLRQRLEVTFYPGR